MGEKGEKKMEEHEDDRPRRLKDESERHDFPFRKRMEERKEKWES